MQTLKADVKERIVESAKKEFLEKGIERASMREIAQGSQMTVGNLYRYFKNKDELNRIVVEETLKEIDALVMRKSSNMISLKDGEYEINMTVDQYRTVLDELGDEMLDIYAKHRIEFRILMMHSRLNDEITDWFTGLLASIIKSTYKIAESEENIRIMAHCYAVSIFSGLRDLMCSSGLSAEELKLPVRIFFRSFINSLSVDLNSYLGN